MKKLFVGKLAFSTTESSLRELFANYEPLRSVKIISDKFSGDSRGFGFVEIEDDRSADEAVEALNGADLDGRSIVVNEARPQGEGFKSSNGRSGGYRDSQGSRRGGGYGSSSNDRY